MEIQDLFAAPPPETTPVVEPGSNSDLGQEDFLAMLIAQLESQDPLNPQDGTEFTAQLAQFSSLDQLISMRTSLDSLTSVEGDAQNLAAAGLIGREALVETLSFGVSAEPGATLPTLFLETSVPITLQGLQVRNSAGQAVANLPAQALNAGRTELDWGELSEQLGPGVYDVRLTPAPGSPTPRVLVQSRVTGTLLDGSSPTLVLDGAEVPLTALREVRE